MGDIGPNEHEVEFLPLRGEPAPAREPIPTSAQAAPEKMPA